MRRRRVPSGMLMAALLLAATLSAPSAPSAPVATAPATDPVSDLLAQLNAERLAAGLAPLRAEPALLKIAGARAEEVARTQDFDGCRL